jgi:hypothetical protein
MRKRTSFRQGSWRFDYFSDIVFGPLPSIGVGTRISSMGLDSSYGLLGLFLMAMSWHT